MKISIISLILGASIATFSNAMTVLNYGNLAKWTNDAELAMQKEAIDMQAVDNIIESSPPELKKIITEYQNKEFFKDTISKFIFLSGKPGVGKSTLARGIAIKANIPYQFIQCPIIATEYQNSGTQNLRRIFEPILKHDREVAIILDEITAITNKHNNKNDTDMDMATEFWQIMDEMDIKKQFFLIIATTNSNDIPDPLKTRFGDASFKIPLPDKKTRICIVEHYLDKMNASYESSIPLFIANKMNHSSGRLLEKLCKKIVSNSKHRALNAKTKKFNIDKQDIEKALIALNSSLKVIGYTQHSELYDKTKKIILNLVPYTIPALGLAWGIYAFYKQYDISKKSYELAIKSYQLAQGSSVIQEKSFELATAGAVIAEKNLAISQDSQFKQTIGTIATVGTAVANVAVPALKVAANAARPVLKSMANSSSATCTIL